jgi:quercetin dioxygenase-like cupin family protein
MENLENSVIFKKGEKVNIPYFTGTAYLEMLTPFGGDFTPIGNVTFEPCCRNYWHKHAGGQILLITGGEGYYQEYGNEARLLHAGDVVMIPRNVKHWHGATKDSWFTHLAIENDTKAGPTEWLEPVTDEEYNNLFYIGQKHE